MKVKIKGVLFIVLLILNFLPVINAQEKNFDHVVSNSEKWQDVYSSMIYATLNNVGSDFLVSTPHGDVLLNNINKNNRIKVITSSKNPYVFNYLNTIRLRKFAEPTEMITENANIDLIKEMPEINNFIIVGDSYGFNAIAVTPYAIITKSWVFLSNRLNIYELDGVLSTKNINKIIIYGYVDKEVRNVLSKYNPEIIDNNDRFKDNIEIVKKYIELKPVKQVAFTNGEFIEKELMNGLEPVLFTGKENVPDEINEYLKTSDIEVGVLVGNDLVGAATNIKRSSGINVMVKFARGARAETSGVSLIEGLDLFPLPTPSIKITVYSIRYNRATNLLEVTYKSDSNAPAYIKGTFTLSSGGENTRVGDIESIFISPGDYKTIMYSVNLSFIENIKAEVYVLFGESSTSLDRVLRGSMDVSIINIIDNCKIERENIQSIKYNKQKKAFIIKIKNSNPVDCWYDLELNNILIGYTKQTFSIENGVLIKSGKIKEIILYQELDKSDLENNEYIRMTLYSGEKEDSLVNKLIFDKIKLSVENLTVLTYVIIGLVILIIILIIIIFLIRRRDKDEED
jgi:hypothetical protein